LGWQAHRTMQNLMEAWWGLLLSAEQQRWQHRSAARLHRLCWLCWLQWLQWLHWHWPARGVVGWSWLFPSRV